MKIIYLPEAGSTNSFLATMPQACSGTVVVAHAQTAGRGQRGNTWEAEPGCNLTFSMLHEPRGVDVGGIFALSEAAALAVTHTLDTELDDVTVKWPNDIYAGGDRKIAGLLLENSLEGRRVKRCIVGIGLNVNQMQFRSDAPNPVSLAQLTGRTYNLEDLGNRLYATLERYLRDVDSADGRERMHRLYLQRLWRREGFHPYRLPSGETFTARIDDVALTGHIKLTRPDGASASYAFKEISAII